MKWRFGNSSGFLCLCCNKANNKIRKMFLTGISCINFHYSQRLLTESYSIQQNSPIKTHILSRWLLVVPVLSLFTVYLKKYKSYEVTTTLAKSKLNTYTCILIFSTQSATLPIVGVMLSSRKRNREKKLYLKVVSSLSIYCFE